MQLTNTTSRYGAIDQTIHWLTAALVAFLLISGKTGEIEPEQSSALYFWHSSIGVTILLLTILRIAWRFLSRPPRLPATMSKWGRGMARTLHALFYILLVALPLSGWLAASSEGGSVMFFGASLPRATASAPPSAIARGEEEDELAGPGEGKEEFWEETHEVLGNVLLALAILHVLAALKHHFVDKDDVLQRMLPKGMTSGRHLAELDSHAPQDTGRSS